MRRILTCGKIGGRFCIRKSDKPMKKNLMRVWLIRFGLVLVLMVFFLAMFVFAQAHPLRAALHSPAQHTAITATPSPIGFVASPTPTPLAPDPVVAGMLSASEGARSAMDILEYVHEHRYSPYRARLLAHVMDLANVDFPLDWLAEQWLDENVIAALNQTGEVPATTVTEIRGFWRGEFVAMDWDNDHIADYVVTLRWGFAGNA